MRFLRNTLAVGGLTLALTGAASAQVNVFDTIGNASNFWNSGAGTTGKFLGADPVPGGGRPSTAATAGYVVVPFTVSSIEGGKPLFKVNEVSVSLNSLTPNGASGLSNFNNLSVAFARPTADNTLFSTGLSGSSFFNLSNAGTLPAGSVRGDSQTHIFTFTPGQNTYLDTGNWWLVISPKKGLNVQDGELDSIFNTGIVRHATAGQINGANTGANTVSSFATVNRGLWQQAGARQGATLQNNVTGPTSFFFNARVKATGVVPAPPSAIVLLTGSVPMALTMLRRRRKSA